MGGPHRSLEIIDSFTRVCYGQSFSVRLSNTCCFRPAAISIHVSVGKEVTQHLN